MGRTFISVNPTNILWAAHKNPREVVPDAVDAINILANPALDLRSGISVGAEFVCTLITRNFPWPIVLDYFGRVL